MSAQVVVAVLLLGFMTALAGLACVVLAVRAVRSIERRERLLDRAIVALDRERRELLKVPPRTYLNVSPAEQIMHCKLMAGER